MDSTSGAALEGSSRLRALSPQSHSRASNGKDATLAAGGGFDAEASASENTPLLLRGQDSSFGQSFPPGALDQDAPQDEPDDTSPNEWPGQADFEGLPWWRRPSLFKLLVPFAIFMMAFGGIIVPKVNLINDLICRDYYNRQVLLNGDTSPANAVLARRPDDCDASEVVAASSTFTMWCNLVAGLLSALASPKLGSLSDRYGRVRILVLSSAGLLVNEVATICAAKFPETFSVNWILFGFAVDGLGGSFITGMAVGAAYATDVTPPSRRNVAFGYFHGCLYAGIALGPLLAAEIIKAFNADLLTLFYIAFGCHIFFMSSLLFFVPESLSKERQLIARKRFAAIYGSEISSVGKQMYDLVAQMFVPLNILRPTGPGTTPALRRNLIILAAIDTTVFGVAMGSLTVIILYMKNMFHWTVGDQSLFVSLVNTSRVLCLFIILPIVVRLVRGPVPSATNGEPAAPQLQNGADTLDLVLMRLGVILDTVGFIGYSIATATPLFILSGVVASLGGIGSPTIASSMTKHIPHDQVGQLLGAMGLLHALARSFAPLVFNGIFALTVRTFPQAVFVSLTGAFGVALILSFLVRPGLHVSETSTTEGEDRPAADGQ